MKVIVKKKMHLKSQFKHISEHSKTIPTTYMISIHAGKHIS